MIHRQKHREHAIKNVMTDFHYLIFDHPYPLYLPEHNATADRYINYKPISEIEFNIILHDVSDENIESYQVFSWGDQSTVNQKYPQMTIDGAGGGPGTYPGAIRVKWCDISVNNNCLKQTAPSIDPIVLQPEIPYRLYIYCTSSYLYIEARFDNDTLYDSYDDSAETRFNFADSDLGQMFRFYLGADTETDGDDTETAANVTISEFTIHSPYSGGYCHLQGPCHNRCVDVTDGDYQWNDCGVACIGGSGYTDSLCNCACI